MLNEAVKLVRQFHGLSLSDLADRLGVSKSYLSEVEHGHKKVTLDLLNRYSEVLDMPVSHLMLFAENAGASQPVERVRRAVAAKALAMLRWVEQISRDKPGAAEADV